MLCAVRDSLIVGGKGQMKDVYCGHSQIYFAAASGGTALHDWLVLHMMRKCCEEKNEIILN